MPMMVVDRGVEACDGDIEFADRDRVAGQYALDAYDNSLSDAGGPPTVLEPRSSTPRAS